MNVWLWEMEMCCSMQLEKLREIMAPYRGQELVPGTMIDPMYQTCPHDETLFEGLFCHVEVREDGRLEVIGRVRYWNPEDGGWDKTASLKIFDNFDECWEWLQDEGCASQEECAEKLYRLGK